MIARTRIRSFGADREAVSGVEFSMILPLLLALFFGGFSVAKTTAISRKITITTRALADLTSQYTTIGDSDVSTIMTASTQILAPFSSSPLSIRLTEIQLDSSGASPTVTFSRVSGKQFTAYKAGSAFNSLPSNLPATANAAYILAETYYSYSLISNSSFAPPITLGDQIYMLPRLSASITYTGS